MIKIIKDGRKEFVGNCDMCGCKFSYDISDVAFTSHSWKQSGTSALCDLLPGVPCPCCGHHYVHKNLLYDFTTESLNSISIRVIPGELQK